MPPIEPTSTSKGSQPIPTPSQKPPTPTFPPNASLRAKSLKFRLAITSILFAATIASGAWYGASLKTSFDVKKERKKFEEVSVEEKIKVLEESKKGLLAKRDGLERKIKQLEERKAT